MMSLAKEEYSQMHKQQLIEIIQRYELKNKDLQEKYQQLLKQQEIYKSKLEEQIEENQKSIKTFAQITQIAIKAIKSFSKIDTLTLTNSTQSDKNEAILKIIRNSSESIDFMASIDNSIQNEVQSSQINYIEQIISQTINIMNYIAQIAESFEDNILRIQQQMKSIESDKKQISCLNRQIQKLTLDNQILKKILNNVQSEKFQIINHINKASTQNDQNYQNLEKQELLNQVKRLIYRVNQLENCKRQKHKQQIISYKSQIQKYQNILTQLKEHKKYSSNYSINS